jgi:hypothetical protein
MLKRVLWTLCYPPRNARGTSLIELSVSLLLMSVVATGLVGAAAVGVRVGSSVESRDRGFTIARAQAEYIASLPGATEYSSFPSHPTDRTITGAVTENCLGRRYLQCITIDVFSEELRTADSTLQIFKAERFVELEPGAKQPVVPTSAGLDKLRSLSLPPIPPRKGVAVRIPKVIPSVTPTDVLVRWELSSGSDDESRIVAIYRGAGLMAGQTGEFISVFPPEAPAPLLAIGELREGAVLSVGARDLKSGDYTVYFYNNSASRTVETRSTEISCLCSLK